MEDKTQRFFYSIVIMLMLSSFSYAQEQIVANPNLDFIETASKMGDFAYLPRGKEVYRLDLDLYSNKKHVIFLSFKRWGSKAGNGWIAYAPIGGGYVRVKNSADLVFRIDGFYAIDPKGGLFVLYPGRGGGDLVHYDIKNGAVQMRKLQSVDYSKSEDKKYVENILGHKLEDRSSEDHPAYKILTVSAIEADAN